MLEFMRKAYAVAVVIVFLIFYVACIVVGYHYLGEVIWGEPHITGAIFGKIIGFVFVIIGGGQVATFISIGKNVNQIANKYTEISEKVSSIEKNVEVMLSNGQLDEKQD